MNMLKKFVAGLGQQNAPFGFAPESPDASYQAGLGYIGDIGANLLANNQSGVDPFSNLGASMLQAKDSSTRRNKEQYTAQRLMEEAPKPQNPVISVCKLIRYGTETDDILSVCQGVGRTLPPFGRH